MEKLVIDKARENHMAINVWCLVTLKKKIWWEQKQRRTHQQKQEKKPLQLYKIWLWNGDTVKKKKDAKQVSYAHMEYIVIYLIVIIQNDQMLRTIKVNFKFHLRSANGYNSKKKNIVFFF